MPALAEQVQLDVIHDGRAYGDVADRLLDSGLDPDVLRPWKDSRGRTCIAVMNRRTKKRETRIVANAPATLSRDQWKLFDDAVVRAARPQLRVWQDIVGAGLTQNIPNAMGVTVIQHQTMTDAGEATISMDALRRTNRDRVLHDIGLIPVPIIHSDFHFSLREIEVSRRNGMPLDTTMIEQNTRKCAEQVEKLVLGLTDSYSYGGGTIYGLTNFPQRVTYSLTAPTDAGWEPETTVNEVLDMIQQAQDVRFNGPYGIWYAPAWTKYFGADYSANYGGKTLRQRLRDVSDEGEIRFWRKADYLTGFQILLVQLTPDVIQAMMGMRFRTLQWDSHGGLQKNFKIMGIMFPRIRKNSDDDTGIVHGS